MKPEERESLLDEIAVANVEQLRTIVSRLEDMPQSPDVDELHDIATDNMYALCGAGGDW